MTAGRGAICLLLSVSVCRVPCAPVRPSLSGLAPGLCLAASGVDAGFYVCFWLLASGLLAVPVVGYGVLFLLFVWGLCFS